MTPCQKCDVGANRRRGQTFYYRIEVQEQNRLIWRGRSGFYHRMCAMRVSDDIVRELVFVGRGETP